MYLDRAVEEEISMALATRAPVLRQIASYLQSRQSVVYVACRGMGRRTLLGYVYNMGRNAQWQRLNEGTTQEADARPDLPLNEYLYLLVDGQTMGDQKLRSLYYLFAGPLAAALGQQITPVDSDDHAYYTLGHMMDSALRQNDGKYIRLVFLVYNFEALLAKLDNRRTASVLLDWVANPAHGTVIIATMAYGHDTAKEHLRASAVSEEVSDMFISSIYTGQMREQSLPPLDLAETNALLDIKLADKLAMDVSGRQINNVAQLDELLSASERQWIYQQSGGFPRFIWPALQAIDKQSGLQRRIASGVNATSPLLSNDQMQRATQTLYQRLREYDFARLLGDLTDEEREVLGEVASGRKPSDTIANAYHELVRTYHLIDEDEVSGSRRLRIPLLARYIGEHNPANPPTLTIVDGKVRLGDTIIELNPKDLELLSFLVEHPGSHSSQALLAQVWENNAKSHTTVVNAVTRIRKRVKEATGIDEDIIKNSYRQGYSLAAGFAPTPSAPIVC